MKLQRQELSTDVGSTTWQVRDDVVRREVRLSGHLRFQGRSKVALSFERAWTAQLFLQRSIAWRYLVGIALRMRFAP
jgi:hypothetical protein